MSKQLFLLDLVLIFCVLALVSAQVAFNVNATYRSFNSPTTKQGIGNKWNLNTSGVLCASQDGNKSLSWRSKYGWAAFCGVWLSKHACGKCLNVTNKDSGSTLAQVRFPITQTVRIVDNCSHGGLDLDMDVFQKLDTSGYGMSQGYLVVDYEFVDCVSGTLAAAPVCSDGAHVLSKLNEPHVLSTIKNGTRQKALSEPHDLSPVKNGTRQKALSEPHVLSPVKNGTSHKAINNKSIILSPTPTPAPTTTFLSPNPLSNFTQQFHRATTGSHSNWKRKVIVGGCGSLVWVMLDGSLLKRSHTK